MSTIRTMSILAISTLLGAGCALPGPVSPLTPSEPTQRVASLELSKTPVFKPTPSDLEALVKTYFTYLDSKNYANAYTLLDSSYQESNPFISWSSGYKNTLHHVIDFISCSGNSCTVVLLATENTQSDLRQQRYVLRYSFNGTSVDTLKINTGELLSTKTEKILQERTPTPTVATSTITDSIVQIVCFIDDTFSDASSGSGTIIRSSGIILSNFHVKTEDSSNCFAIGVDSQGVLQSDKVYRITRSLLEDPIKDLWVAEIINDDALAEFTPLRYRICTPKEVLIGDSVRVYGFPYQAAQGNMVLTEGIVSGINAQDGSFVTSAKIDHGNSGGLAINTSKNCFIGIPTRIRGKSEVYGQIVGISDLAKRFPELFEE